MKRTLLAAAVTLVIANHPAVAFEAEEQVVGSDLIVTGRVLSVAPATDALGRPSEAEAEVEVNEVWKGSPETARVRVRMPGGALDNPGLSIEGSARLASAEEVLLFLTRSGDSYRPWRTVFGKYPIRGSGADARVTAGILPLLDDPDGLDPDFLALDEVRHEVKLIVASHPENESVDVAMGGASDRR